MASGGESEGLEEEFTGRRGRDSRRSREGLEEEGKVKRSGF